MDYRLSIEFIFGVLVMLVGVVVWFVRLEGRINQTEKYSSILRDEVTSVKNKLENLDFRLVEKLSVIEKHLAKIEGRLSIKDSE